MTASLESLFSPLQVNGLKLRNRFVMPGMTMGVADHGMPPAKAVKYLRDRALGGVSLIIGEGCCIDHPSAYWQPIFTQLSQDTEGAWKDIIDGVHDGGAPFLLQLWHAGAMRSVPADSPHASQPTLSPSGLLQDGRQVGRAMDDQDLEEVLAEYVRGALRAQRLGADGIEIHAAHGFLLDQFMWHETNLRKDRYGGPTLAERARYPAEVTAAIRRAVGPDFVISFRLSQWKEVDYGAKLAQSPEELGELLAVIREAGADCFHISTRRFNSPEWPELDPDLGLAGWAKRLIDAPVIAVGSVGLSVDLVSDLVDEQDPVLQIEEDLDRLVRRFENDEFDLIAVGRAHIANPDFVSRVRDGSFDQLRTFNRAVDIGEAMDAYEWDVLLDDRSKTDFPR